MERAILPVAIGASFGGLAWWRALLLHAGRDAASRALVEVLGNYIASLGAEGFLDSRGLEIIWQLGGVLICIYYWSEVTELGRVTLRFLTGVLSICSFLVSAIYKWLVTFTAEDNTLEVELLLPEPAPEQEVVLTWCGMAALVPGPPVPAGSFVLVSRPPEWDEVNIAAYSENHSSALCRTTSSDGTAWVWVMVQIAGLHMRMPHVAVNGDRQAPGGLADGDINWVCIPPAGIAQWKPTPAELANVIAEGNLVMSQYNPTTTTWPVNVPGVAGPLQEVTMAAVGPVGPVGGGGVALGAAPPAAAGLGVGGAGGGTGEPDMRALEAAVHQLQEVITLAEVLDAVNRKEIAQALDIISQRILAIQQARQKGGSWEKSEAIELVDTRKTLASTSMLALTNIGLKRDALSGSASWDDRASFWGGNVMVAALNWLHGGQQAFTTMVPTAAHGRVHSRLEGALRALVMNDEPTLGPERLDSFLRQTQHYTGTGVVLALGARGGVPDKAADVALADELAPHFPDLARQVTSPSCLLLPAKKRPRKVRKGYTWVSSTYPELVRKNVKAGLQKLKQEHQVAKHGGRLLLAGAFAVVKDDKEDRVITDPSVNQLLNEDSLPRPRFAYIPSLRSVTVPSSGVIKITKRDARHYFHRLRIGRRWGRWLCSPPISLPSQSGPRNRKWYPAAQATPMGFGPSAGWAQALTDAVAIEAGLPQEHRLHPDFTVPEELPIWGSIIDDIWAIEHGDEAAASGVGVDWMNRAEEALAVPMDGHQLRWLMPSLGRQKIA
ncbi:unnamed protein product [Durusdinium trenchii]|uniref:Uncharacterized protein n=1 Tax=Durusdinium trenchii TaxID=1381693 RepID=A0ABP0KEF4_9DINO